MKKLIVFILLIIGTLQLSAQGEFKFGFEMSPGINWLTTNSSDVAGNGGHLGVRLGMVGEYFFADNYSLESGLSLNFNQGGKLRYALSGNYLPLSDLSEDILNEGDTPLPGGTQINYKLQYIEIPFALKMRTQEFGYFRYYATIPMFSLNFITKGEGEISGTNILIPGTNSDLLEKQNIKKDMGFMTLAWGVGGGAEYLISENTTIVVGLYYKQSFIDVIRDKGKTTSEGKEDSKANLNTITLKLGVLF